MRRGEAGAVVRGVHRRRLMALPVMPSSFWNRMDSITNAEEDPTGSREARLRLIDQGVQVFLENPLTGIGAGPVQELQRPGDTVEKWRVTHNVWLQVAAELGIFGLVDVRVPGRPRLPRELRGDAVAAAVPANGRKAPVRITLGPQ